jgi:hypothetical protein
MYNGGIDELVLSRMIGYRGSPGLETTIYSLTEAQNVTKISSTNLIGNIMTCSVFSFMKVTNKLSFVYVACFVSFSAGTHSYPQ